MNIRAAAFLSGISLAACSVESHPASAARLEARLVSADLRAPVFATSPPGDSHRIFVVEQLNGRIRIVRDGQLLQAPFIDIGAKISAGGEKGFLGLAFHPNYAADGYFYVNYTDHAGDTVIERYTVSADPDLADPTSGLTILQLDQPFGNHNGGMLLFGPDGYLYIGTGDGGGAGDPSNNAQSGTTLLGKMLRIDVDGGTPYAIPPDNPYLGEEPLDEIWSFGLRNPWRYSFDRLTGDLYIADVGQDLWEEIDFEMAQSLGGRNYGWRLMEGEHCFDPPADCDDGTLVHSIHEYGHSQGRCSVTGGYVYRGTRMPCLQGSYFFGDFCTGEVWSFRYVGGQVTDFADWTSSFPEIGLPSSFGEDADGELYICDLAGGELHRIVPIIDLDVEELVGGRQGNAEISCAAANERIYVAYSLVGAGSTYIPLLDVTLDLEAPRFAGFVITDGNGDATFARPIPEEASGRTLYIQVVETGARSGVVTRTVQ